MKLQDRQKEEILKIATEMALADLPNGRTTIEKNAREVVNAMQYLDFHKSKELSEDDKGLLVVTQKNLKSIDIKRLSINDQERLNAAMWYLGSVLDGK